jgi:hypothetical protein
LAAGVSIKIPSHYQRLRDAVIRHCKPFIEQDDMGLWLRTQGCAFIDSEDGVPWGSPLIQSIIGVLFMGNTSWSIEKDLMNPEHLDAPLLQLVVSLVTHSTAPLIISQLLFILF